MEAKSIPTSWDGCIRLDLLRTEILKNKDKPIIINANIGTTVKGAVDNIDGIIGVLKQINIPRERYFIHCDGALFAMMLPFLERKNKLSISFEMPIDSIAISGHKFLGCPMPCGVMITRKELMKPLLKPIEYLNSVDSTITGSRNGLSSLFIWNVINTKGIDGFKDDVEAKSPGFGFGASELAKAGKGRRSAQRNQGCRRIGEGTIIEIDHSCWPAQLSIEKPIKKRGNSSSSRIILHIGIQKLVAIAAEDYQALISIHVKITINTGKCLMTHQLEEKGLSEPYAVIKLFVAVTDGIFSVTGKMCPS